MPATVIINNLTVVHKQSGGTSVAAPDVCKTPTPSGPVPLPYANTALSRDVAKGGKRTRIDGQPPALKSSTFSSSAGNEPGSLGGIISGKTKGRAKPRSYSLDVKVENQPVVRFTDVMVQNAGAAPNATGIISQPSGAATGLDPDKVEVVELRWSTTKLCCGDPVTLHVATQNAKDGQPVQVWARRTDPSRWTTMEGLAVEVHGNKAEVPWISRWRFKFRENIPAVAAQETLKGAQKSSNALEFQNPPAQAKQTIHAATHWAWKFVWCKKERKWIKNGEHYAWEVAFDIAIADGWMIVRRELDFNLRSGQAPVSPLTWRAWAQEIEAVWDRKFYFHRVDCKREHRCDCSLIGCCKYPLRIFAKQGAVHGEVDLFEGAPRAKNWGKPDLWWYSHTWWTELGEANRFVRAHEFGHLIGCYDEYKGGACQTGGHWVGAPNSIMNDGRTVFPRHVETFRKMFSAASPVVGAVRTVRV